MWRWVSSAWNTAVNGSGRGSIGSRLPPVGTDGRSLCGFTSVGRRRWCRVAAVSLSSSIFICGFFFFSSSNSYSNSNSNSNSNSSSSSNGVVASVGFFFYQVSFENNWLVIFLAPRRQVNQWWLLFGWQRFLSSIVVGGFVVCPIMRWSGRVGTGICHSWLEYEGGWRWYSFASDKWNENNGNSGGSTRRRRNNQLPAEEWTAQGEGDSVPADLIFFIDGVLLLLLLPFFFFLFIIIFFWIGWWNQVENVSLIFP